MSLNSELEHLLELYRRYHALAQVTVGLLKQANYEALDDAWAKRRELFKRLTAARAKLAPLFADWEPALSGLEEAQKEKCSRLVGQVEDLGKKTLALDQEAATLMEGAQTEIKNSLNHLQKGANALKAYHGTAHPPPARNLITKSG